MGSMTSELLTAPVLNTTTKIAVSARGRVFTEQSLTSSFPETVMSTTTGEISGGVVQDIVTKFIEDDNDDNGP